MKYVVFDIDGVLARPNPERMALIGALPGGGTDWDAFYATDFSKDVVIEAGFVMLASLQLSPGPENYFIVFLTSRSDCVRGDTGSFILEKEIVKGRSTMCSLLMRDMGDERPAWEVKLDLLLSRGITPENTLFVVDDEIENVNAFAAAGYTTLLFKDGVK